MTTFRIILQSAEDREIIATALRHQYPTCRHDRGVTWRHISSNIWEATVDALTNADSLNDFGRGALARKQAMTEPMDRLVEAVVVVCEALERISNILKGEQP